MWGQVRGHAGAVTPAEEAGPAQHLMLLLLRKVWSCPLPRQHGTEGTMQIQLRLMQVLIMSHQLSSCPAKQGTRSCCSLCRKNGFAPDVCRLCLCPCPQPAPTTLL